MKSRIWLYIGLAITILVGLYCSPYLGYIPSKKDFLADKVSANAAKKIVSSKPLYLIGEGGQMLDEIAMLSLSFQCFEVMDLNHSRQLIVYAIETFLEEINKNSEIHPFLKNYPFTADNVEIEIWFSQPDHSEIQAPNIKLATSEDGQIKYYPGKPDYNIKNPILIEAYEDAVKLLSNSSSNKKTEN